MNTSQGSNRDPTSPLRSWGRFLLQAADKRGDLSGPPQHHERTAEVADGGKVTVPIPPTIAAHIKQKRKIETLGASGRHIGAYSTERTHDPAQNASKTTPGPEIEKDGGIRDSEASDKCAAEISVHDPLRSADQGRDFALPCRPIGLPPTWTPIMPIEMNDRKPGNSGDLPGEG
jgi:hypothetical protein